MEDQARFYRFTEADLVGEQDSRRESPGNFRRDVKLMWNEIDSAARESANVRFAPAMLMLERRKPQVEHSRRMELPGEQTFLGFIEAYRIVKLGFADFP